MTPFVAWRFMRAAAGLLTIMLWAANAQAAKGEGELMDPTARDAIARVAIAEAGNQGDSGLAAVVFTIFNRLTSRRWGSSVQAVVNWPGQFEPVMRAGGDWRRLPAPSAQGRARIDTIINLALDGRLPDLTHGARYFQNPRLVEDRASRGEVSSRLPGFGGATPTAVVGAHVFYAHLNGRRGRLPSWSVSYGTQIFIGENRALQFIRPPPAPPANPVPSPLFAGAAP